MSTVAYRWMTPAIKAISNEILLRLILNRGLSFLIMDQEKNKGQN